ncbi:MAG: hypothetical protein Q9159_003622 [Coniocarpon cinnabarinum]
MASPRVFQVASIPGDGIGTEITEAAREESVLTENAPAIQVLNTLAEASNNAFSFKFDHLDYSSENYAKRGYYMPSDGITRLKQSDAIFFGAVGWPSVPDHISLWSLILPIRKELSQYVNLRPVRVLPGVTAPLSSVAKDPSSLDWLIVRENSEGEYSGQGGLTHPNSPHELGTELAIFLRPALERIFRFAFAAAYQRPRRHLTMVTKSNAQRHGMVLWDAVFYEVAKEWEGKVTHDKMLVDAMTVRMVNNPASLDTIVATNLHADILSDLAAALGGSIGIAPSANLDPTRRYPSMFEPIHGSAPDIAGKGVANPIGAFWSAAEMVRWLGGVDNQARGAEGVTQGEGVKGMAEAADRLMEAIENVTGAGVRTRDLGGTGGTKDVTEAVCEEVKKLSRGGQWK